MIGFRIAFAMLICAALFAGCGMNRDELEAIVRAELQRDVVKRSGMKNLKVRDVQLVRESDGGYVGVAQCAIGKSPVKFDVKCKYDGGDDVLWSAELSKDNDLALLARESVKDFGMVLKAKAKEACDSAAKASKELCNAAAVKAKELCDSAAKEADKIIDELN